MDKFAIGEIIRVKGYSDEYEGGQADYIVVAPSEEYDFTNNDKTVGFKKIDDLREFEEIRSYFETCSKHKEIVDGERFIYSHAEKLTAHAMKEWRKRHTEQNSGNSIDFGEPLPEILKKQCGFGEKK